MSFQSGDSHVSPHGSLFVSSSLEDVYLPGYACYDRARCRDELGMGKVLEHVGASSETGSSHVECVVSGISRLSSLQKRRFGSEWPPHPARVD
ncbi:hypothetical protein COMA2_100045 [Candidatus Nitrospira nitrificans]|uniref:Uncharacterized protein n=1 Tax=Candidatus Nitrospira nitrificans TaxID=1742973 RepID=A0A0S4L935_9BACT|nr:hypothetical protein COMA2_100045 [Candidatus Nitrospira nitrificans]